MPLSPPLIYGEMVAVRASGGFPFAGINYDRLAWAIGYALDTWVHSGGVVLSGVAVGTAGSGNINTPTTRLVLIPNPALVLSGLTSAGMAGPLSVSLATVVALGVAKAFSTYGQYAGAVVGVGTGADVSRVLLANGPALVSHLLTYHAAMVGPGLAASQMATGLGTGIASLVLTTTGTGTVIGSASPAPATGNSTSVVV